MKTVQVSELSELALCYAVCMIEMPHLVWKATIDIHAHSHQIIVPELKEPDCYSPYTDWAMFGPIIKREGISLCYAEDNPKGMEWYAYDTIQSPDDDVIFASTPLVAAMRCYVASKLGDTIEIPEDLRP